MEMTFIGPYGERLRIGESAYATSGQTALEIIDEEDGASYAVLTVNVPGARLAPSEILVKTWSPNQEIAECALRSGYFQDTGRRVPCGFATAHVWLVNRQH